MGSIFPKEGNRIIIGKLRGESVEPVVTSNITEVIVDDTNPFWIIKYGNSSEQDSGAIVLDEDLIVEVIESITRRGKGWRKCGKTY